MGQPIKLAQPAREDRVAGPPARKPEHSPDTRSPWARDRDRVLYAEAFRRLTGVTQVAGAHEGRVFHNRLQHTLKVGQIARRLAERLIADGDRNSDVAEAILNLGGLDPEVAEAAALAHDLGHPPFGHIAEEELDRLVLEKGGSGFEGNAQTFRIVATLGIRDPNSDHDGLGLTRATLRAIVKYPWPRAFEGGSRHPLSGSKRGKKWACYECESQAFDFAMALPVEAGLREADTAQRSVEAEIMDWADDVTYAIHDLEDFYRAGLIPLAELQDRSSSEWRPFIEFAAERLSRAVQEVDDAFYDIRGFLPQSSYKGSRQQLGILHNSATLLIGRLLSAFRVVPGPALLEVDKATRLQVDVLKQLTWKYVIVRSGLATQQEGQRRIITFLYEYYWELLDQKKPVDLVPAGLRHLVGTEKNERIAADIVANLTEQEAVMLYQRLNGHVTGSVLDQMPV